MSLELRIAAKISPSLPGAGSSAALSAGTTLFFGFFFPSLGLVWALRFGFDGIAPSAIAAAIARRTTASALEPLKSLFGGAERPNGAEQN
jgi:hypothetical protein